MLTERKLETKGDLKWVVHRGGRKASFLWKLKNNLRWAYIKGWIAKYIAGPIANLFGVATILGELKAIHYKKDGTYVDYGVVGRRVVTTAYCQFMVDQHQTETSEVGDFKYHEMGTGGTAENAADTDIETVHGSVGTGTQTEGTTVQYQSVGTISAAGTAAIVEHVLMSQSSTGTLMDRTVFSAVNIVSGDSIQFTYTITYTAGS